MVGFTTKSVHGTRSNRDIYGSLRPPLYDSVAFEFNESRDLELAFAGKKPSHAYSRITNPTVEELEQRIRLLCDAFGVIAVSSGMAAITNTIMALAHTGSNIVTTRHLFGHSLSLFSQTLGRWGLQTRFADMTVPSTLESTIDENTALIFLEVISNPQLEVTDIATICEIAARKNIPVVLDGTLTTPYLYNSKNAGVAIEIISSTKHISGGATSVGGLIIDNGVFDWHKTPILSDMSDRFGPGAFLMRLRKEVYRNTGACLSAHNAWLQILGLETLSLRIDASCRNAETIADFLQGEKKVLAVHYPGLESSPWHAVAARQFPRGFGSILTFELSGKDTCFTFMDNLKLIRKATNLNENKSLIIHPASTIFAEFNPGDRAAMGISEGLIRLSVGIEDSDDLLHDIREGLQSL
jgi:O-acetylhomoserine (thiol)-lyase